MKYLNNEYISFDEYDIVKIYFKPDAHKINYILVCWPKDLKIKKISENSYKYNEDIFTYGIINLVGKYDNFGSNFNMIGAKLASKEEQIEFIEKMLNSKEYTNINSNTVKNLFKKYYNLVNK